MRDYLNMGGAPVNAECSQLGEPDYYEKARAECKRFRAQLRKTFGEEPEGATLAIKSFPTNFGKYLEVVCWFDDDLLQSVEYAFRLEANCPLEWDD